MSCVWSDLAITCRAISSAHYSFPMTQAVVYGLKESCPGCRWLIIKLAGDSICFPIAYYLLEGAGATVAAGQLRTTSSNRSAMFLRGWFSRGWMVITFEATEVCERGTRGFEVGVWPRQRPAKWIPGRW
eukprot:scaffold655402_cov57-Prasinocladus_malaysianus.AAC.1